MAWNYTFPYRSKMFRYIVLHILTNKSAPESTPMHTKCMVWLHTNLQKDRDFDLGYEDDTIVYIYFDKEEDIMTFRLACGI